MHFFDIHGQIPYKIGGIDYLMSDLTKASIIIDGKKSTLQSVNINARTPEQLADDLYGDSRLYWTILWVNNIVDPFTEWYMGQEQLMDYCQRKYGDNLYKVRFYRNSETDEVINDDEMSKFDAYMERGDVLPEHIEYVTNFDYERLLNESRKVVKIVPPSLINVFTEEFRRSLKTQLK